MDVDAAGNIFFVIDFGTYRGDFERSQIYKVDAATGALSHIAGSGRRGVRGDGGPAVEAGFGSIGNMVADSAGNLFVTDHGGLRKIDAASGLIITVVRRESIVIGPDGEQQDISSFLGLGENDDISVWLSDVDSAGNPLMSFANAGPGGSNSKRGNVLFRFESATGAITSVLGTGYRDRSRTTSYEKFVAGGMRMPGDGGPAVQAPWAGLYALVDAADNIFVADYNSYGNDVATVIRRIDAVTGIIDTIAGGGHREANLSGPLSSVEWGQAWVGNTPALLSSTLLNIGSQGWGLDGDGNLLFFRTNGVLCRLTPWGGGPAPTIAEGGVAQATGTPAVERISPNALISVFGQDFTAQGEPALAAGIDASGGVPVNLADTCLYIYRQRREPEFRGRNRGGDRDYPYVGRERLPLFLVSPTQINAQAPHDLRPGETALLQVVRGCGTADELSGFAHTRIEASAASPAFFNLVNNPNGRNPLVAQHGGGPALVGPPELGAAFTPAAPGEVVTLYGTGFGPTDPPLEAGVVPGAPAALVYPLTFRVGGKAVPPQDVLYAGAAPCCAGLYQFSLRLPADLPDGDAPVTANVLGGVFTPQGPFLPVRRR